MNARRYDSDRRRFGYTERLEVVYKRTFKTFTFLRYFGDSLTRCGAILAFEGMAGTAAICSAPFSHKLLIFHHISGHARKHDHVSSSNS